MNGYKRDVLMLAFDGYEELAARVTDGLPVSRGHIESSRFPDGERYLRVHGDVANKNVVLVGGTHSDDAFLDLYEAGCNVSANGARSLLLIVPYYGYATMERASQPGEVVTAKTRARALSSIPVAQTGNMILLMDLHTEGIVHYFQDSITSRVLSARPVLRQLILDLGLEDPVIAATDAGRAKWVAELANELGYQAAFVYKRRLGDRLEVTGVNAEVAGRPVVMYDDIVRTGGSLLQAAAAYREQGASSVHAVATHLVLAGDGLDKIMASPAIDGLSGTDTHPASARLKAAGGTVATIAPVLRDAMIARYPYLE